MYLARTNYSWLRVSKYVGYVDRANCGRIRHTNQIMLIWWPKKHGEKTFSQMNINILNLPSIWRPSLIKIAHSCQARMKMFINWSSVDKNWPTGYHRDGTMIWSTGNIQWYLNWIPWNLMKSQLNLTISPQSPPWITNVGPHCITLLSSSNHVEAYLMPGFGCIAAEKTMAHQLLLSLGWFYLTFFEQPALKQEFALFFPRFLVVKLHSHTWFLFESRHWPSMAGRSTWPLAVLAWCRWLSDPRESPEISNNNG